MDAEFIQKFLLRMISMLIFLQGCRQISDKPGLTITKAGEIIDFLMVPGYLSQSRSLKLLKNHVLYLC